MDAPSGAALRIGDWRLDPVLGQLSREGTTVRLEARTLRLLLYLADHAGQVVSIDQLLDKVWTGVVVNPDSVYQAVTSLRRLLGDDARQPTYIVTVPRLGYRLVAAVGPWGEGRTAAADPALGAGAAFPDPAQPPHRGLHARVLGAAALVIVLVIAGVLAYRVGPGSRAPAIQARSVGVVPFLDLTTQEMTEEYFADGMTEELINKLSRVPGLKVAGPTASFYFKGRQVPPAGIAQSLGVAYLVDGSIRKSGPTIRVSVRLVRAADGFVIWSETYDRPAEDRLAIQDQIATAVANSLGRSIG